MEINEIKKCLVEYFSPKVAESLLNNPNFNWLHDSTSLPGYLINSDRTINGVYSQGMTSIIRANLSPENIPGVVLHEIGIHHGLENMIGKPAYKNILNDIERKVKSGDKAMQIARALVPKDTHPENINQETLAYYVEKWANHRFSLTESIRSKCRSFLFRKFGFGKLEVEDFITLAKASVKSTLEPELKLSSTLSTMSMGKQPFSEYAGNDPHENVLRAQQLGFNTEKIWYRYTPEKLNQFTTSNNDDQNTSVQLTSDISEAKKYANSNPNGQVNAYYLRTERLVSTQEAATREEIEQLVLNSLGLKSINELNSLEKNTFYNSPLSNWAESATKAFERVVNQCLQADTQYEAFQQVERLVYGSDYQAYTRAVTNLGFSGVMIKDKINLGGSERVVVYNPEDIKDIREPFDLETSLSKDTLYSFAGKNALTANLDALNYAKTRKEQGATQVEIWKETWEHFDQGWFYDNDHHWKFEIDDSGSAHKQAITSLLKEYQTKIKKHLNTISEFVNSTKAIERNGTISSNEASRRIEHHFNRTKPLEDMYSKIERSLHVMDSEISGTLGNEFLHSELFSAYPDLLRVQIEAELSLSNDGVSDHGKGQYIPIGDGQIMVEASSKSSLRSIISHELQHSIAHREGFASGGNVQMFKDRDITSQLTKPLHDRIMAVFESNTEYANLQRKLNREFTSIQDQYGYDSKKGRGLDWSQVPSNLSEQYFNLLEKAQNHPQYFEYMELRSKITQLEKNGVIETANEQYQNLAGEVEARNVQYRLDMSVEERIKNPPWTTTDIDVKKIDIRFDYIKHNKTNSLEPFTP